MVIEQVRHLLKSKVLISTITGLTLEVLEQAMGQDCAIVRSMPNTAIAVSQSMTCLSYNGDKKSIETAQAFLTHWERHLLLMTN